MTIIYFLSPTGIDITQKCLKDYLQHLKISPSVFSLTTNYSRQINREYLKLVLPNDVTNPAFYAGLRHRADHHHFDFFRKPTDLPAEGIIAFDMDSTFVEEEGVDEIARRLGISEKITALTREAMEGKIDFDTSFTRRIAMLKGTHKDILHQVCEQMTLSPGLETILPILKEKGFKTAIISGGLDIFTERLKEKYQLDFAFSNSVRIKEDLLTDTITLPIMNAEKKKQTLINLATELSTCRENIIACGDGANDIPMLLHAGNGVAWKAKPKTREKVANQINFNGFESLLFFIEEKL
ncbi:TPA: phosphoserine phosphatase SerB [Escherichia coli]|uniref:Phosphoserine phosphatase n=2 Tax=Escherichia coli TaxID=562 RepID=A0A1M0D697_ECOLX|nr:MULTISPECIES: phosphoserine phosphatase SerB [Enterobacteriaceae]EFO2218259.1 phosphoserine phosphatase SerB [Escherichia coli O11]ATX15438.1 phosphoserine phosphatase SerB [Escherichia coli]AWT02082.1 phosphoserine phosphatase SerB [Escherichia coli]AZR88512.1 phosphoserine phosphatase SerB [Escherichia coli]EAB9241144.1 phosphoserine phosphatase SerB [Escherichia coli]